MVESSRGAVFKMRHLIAKMACTLCGVGTELTHGQSKFPRSVYFLCSPCDGIRDLCGI